MVNNKYITRPISDNMDGWQVRLPLIKKGRAVHGTKETINKLFSISLYKEEAAALRAAKRWRNKYLKDNKALYLLKQRSHLDKPHIISPRNTSGVIGVVHACNIKKLSDGGEVIYESYKGQHCITVKGKRRQRGLYFSFNKYGECAAFKMACHARYKYKGKLIITDIDAIPCLPDVPYTIKDE